MVPEHMRVGPSTARFKLFARSRVTNITTRPVYTAMSSTARYHLRNDAHLVIQKGDITQWEGDAVVNAGMCVALALLCRLVQTLTVAEVFVVYSK